MRRLIDIIKECQSTSFFGKLTITFRKGIPTNLHKEESLPLDSLPSTPKEKAQDFENLKKTINNRFIKEEPNER